VKQEHFLDIKKTGFSKIRPKIKETFFLFLSFCSWLCSLFLSFDHGSNRDGEEWRKEHDLGLCSSSEEP
jgi:hypothetical protein